MKRSILMTGLLMFGAMACSGAPPLTDTASEDPGDPDGGEKTAQTSQALVNFPTWFRIKENNGTKCVSSGPFVGTTHIAFGQETCSLDPHFFFQSGNLHITTWDAFCLDGALFPGSHFNITTAVTCGSTNTEQWSFGAGGHTQQWVNLNEGQCMTCDSKCFQSGCAGNSVDQVYTLDTTAVALPTFQVLAYYPAQSNLCMAPASGLNSGIGTPIVVTPCTGTIEQFWLPSGNLLFWATTDLCLDKAAGQNGDGVGLTLQTCTGNANQQWLRSGPNAYTNMESNRCLDVPAHILSRTSIQMWDCNGGLNQQFAGPHT